MDAARWDQIGRLFEQALEQPPDERAAFLETACPDPALRAEVEALLDAQAGAATYFADLADRAGVPVFDEEDPTDPPAEEEPMPTLDGHVVGPYRIVREIGRGGMGTVYLAERDDAQFSRRVALKLVKRGMDTEAVLGRFLRERQILARLQHPHIARLYDGGVTDDGLPYFAMEYIDGTPIDVYCDEHRLSIDDRLRLFEDVGRAVQYAHRGLVVHRDLKPSNILVTSEGTVKLLDFGIAKLLSDEDEPAGALTRTGMRVMTPAYASPEQVRGEPVTTAADVYTLGLVLYELLTGRRPYPGAGDTPAAIAQAVVAQEPERPSTAVRRVETVEHRDGTTETVTPEIVSRARATQPDRLRRRLSGDLDTICLTALRKEPERRYASAEALVEDVRRHRAGLPVQARPDTPGYRLRKFAGRHKVGVTAAALVVLSLAGGLAAALWQGRIARQEARKAEEVQTFLEGMFAVSDPNVAKGEDLTARALLDRGAERIEDELAGQPEVRAEMLGVVGRLYHTLGLYDQGEDLLRRALSVERELRGNDHPAVATRLNDLANILREQGDYEASEPLYHEALDIQEKRLGAVSPERATTLNNLGLLLTDKGDYEAAEPLLREVVALRRALLGEEHIEVAQSLNELAQALKFDGDFEAAEPLYHESLALQRKLVGEEHLLVANTTENLAMLYARQGDYEAADPLLRETLAIRRNLLGEEHPDVAITLSNLGALHYVRGEYEAAEERFRAALAMHRNLLGDESPHVATDLNNVAAALKGRGAYAEAEALHRETLALQRRLYGEEHPHVAISLHNLAGALYEQGALVEAEQHFEEALAMRRRLLDPEHPDLGKTLAGLGRVWADRKAYADAEPALREAVRILEASLGEANPQTAQAQLGLGRCLGDMRRFDEAETLLQAAYPVLREAYGEEHTFTRQARSALADLYTAWGKPERAAAYAES